MSLPKEPRQLMINLMYLVLTALLAMNVSNEILNAFKTIGRSITNSNKSVEVRNQAVTGAFQKYIDDPKTNEEKKKKVTAAMALADEVNQKTAAIVSQIEGYKRQIQEAAGGIDPETQEIKRIEDLDAGTRVMIEQGNGPKLLQALKDFKDEIAGIVPLTDVDMTPAGKGNNPEVFKNLPLDFTVKPSEGNENADWSYYNFHMSPAIANVTLLDKYISDVRASQSVALDDIWSLATGEHVDKIHVNPRPFNDYAIIVAADNNYVLPGEKYHARIMMGTYNKALNNLSFEVNGRTIIPKDGVAEFDAVAGTNIGPQTIKVTAAFNDTIPGTKTVQRRVVQLDKPAQYFVGESQATISLDKMNVFYIGVDNPITLSASGIPAGNLVYNAENCTLTKAPGVNKYMVRVEPGTAGKKAIIKLSGKLSDGTSKDFGAYEYRIKNIPDPYPVIANKRGGPIAGGELRAQAAVFARLDNFDFDVKFTVVSFDVTYQKKRSQDLELATSSNEYLTGPNANKGVEDLVTKVKVGDKIYFENIKCVGPDKRVRNIGSVNLTIVN